MAVVEIDMPVGTDAPDRGRPTPLRRAPIELEIIIPVLNEERRLPATLDETVAFIGARNWNASIVVVDNGSVDRTAEIVQRYQGSAVAVHLLGCSRRGKGAAVRRGVLTGSSRFVGFMDADLATPIDTLDTMLPLLTDGHAAVVASRYMPGAVLSVEQKGHRRMGGWAFRTLARISVPDVADTQCGFKFFRGDLARSLITDCVVDGFAFDVELLARVQARGHEVIEVPVAWTDVAGSTFSAGRDGLQSMRDVMRVRDSLRATGTG